MQSLLTNAHLILRDRLIDSGWLAIDQGRISGYGEMPVPGEYAHLYPQDLGGAFLMPGIVDLHCDTIEKMIQRCNEIFIATPILAKRQELVVFTNRQIRINIGTAESINSLLGVAYCKQHILRTIGENVLENAPLQLVSVLCLVNYRK